MGSQQLYSYLGRAALWKNVSEKLTENGTQLSPCDAKALQDLCAGVTWMQRVPPALLASYRALYVVLRGDAADAEEDINRDILRTVRAVTGLLLDFSDHQRSDFAGSINRVLNALAHVDDMGYCQGQNYVVDVMMKAGLPERETFCLFLYLLRQGHLHGIYRKEVPVLAGYMDKFEEQLRMRLPELAVHFEAEHYPPPLYALEWITTVFGLAAQPLISLVALDLFLAGARNPVLRLCVSLLGGMDKGLLSLDQEGLLKELRSRAVEVDAQEVIVRALSNRGGKVWGSEVKRSKAGADSPLGWSTGPDYLLVLRSRHCQTVGLVELREESKNGLLVGNSALQDALLAVTRSLGWGRLRTCWLESCLAARSDHERYLLASESLRFVITNGGHSKAAGFMLGVGGADANSVDSRLLSALHLTALFNRPDIARILLTCGASPLMEGGVTRAVAARRGKLLSPLEMAEEACTEGGKLDDAGVAVGPAALFVLRGLVCLQCNVKMPKPAPCDCCKLTFCKPCAGNHFCFGKLDLPQGVAEGAGQNTGAASTSRAPAAGEATGSNDDAGAGAGRNRVAGTGANDDERQTRWKLGSAIGDDWEGLFSEDNANARGGTAHGENEDNWKPGRLRRAESMIVTETIGAGGVAIEAPPAVWATMSSVLLGTWERRPLIASPKDRDKIFDNSAAFVRACYPAQTWLQYHMEEDLGLSLGSARSRLSWGRPFKGLGMRGEHFNPNIMRVGSSTELHRRMSWVMAESGVPWENSDNTWCCPECFMIFAINVFRHHCRGCGMVYCSAHAPPTPVPPEKRNLKLCWSCVLEGAVPLPFSLLDDAAATIIDQLSPTAGTLAASTAGGGYVAPQPPSPAAHLVSFDDFGFDDEDENDDERQKQKNESGGGGGGILSALVSLIEVVAAPESPIVSRREGRAVRERERERERAFAAAQTAEGGTAATKGKKLLNSPEGMTSSGIPRHPGGSTPAAGSVLPEEMTDKWRAGWSASSPLVVGRSWSLSLSSSSSSSSVSSVVPQAQAPLAFRASDDVPKSDRIIQMGSGSSMSTSTVASTDPGDEYEARQSQSQSQFSRGEVDVGVGVGVISGESSCRIEKVEVAAEIEKPVELGFPSERPWALGFGSG